MRTAADRAARTGYDRLDVLCTTPARSTKERRDAPDGTELTVAAQVVGPFLLTGLLLERLAESKPATRDHGVVRWHVHRATDRRPSSR